MTTITFDGEKILTALFIVAIIATIILLPFGMGYWMWMVLAPAGFWQTLACFLFVGSVMTCAYIAEIIVLVIIAGVLD